MGSPRSRALATAAGAALVAAHALALPVLVRHFARPDLDVVVTGPTAAPAWALAGAPPAALIPRVAVALDDAGPGTPGPGLHRLRWTVRYRGGFERSVGAVQLVGPFQDPARPPCSARVVVGQRFLDDGHAGPGTVAHAVAAALTTELRGLSQFPVGDFTGVHDVTVRWATRAAHPEDAGLLARGDPDGYARATATIELDRVTVPVVVALVPRLDADRLRFAIRVRARLDFGNRVINWVSRELDGDAFATRLAKEQLDAGLIAALGPPPPLDLGRGRTLRFDYCGRPPEVADGAWAALPLAVVLGSAVGPDHILPPALGPAPHPMPPAAGTVTLDLDLDAVNAILFELWRTGFLDGVLDAEGLDRRFNRDPDVARLLSVRLSPLRLPLPPVVTARAGGLRLAAEALVTIGDGDHAVLGRIWGGLDFRFPRAPAPALGVDVALGPLELSCAPSPRERVPCYADLVAQLRGRTGQLHGVLTEAFARILTDLFVERHVTATGVPGELVIHSVRARAVPAAPGSPNALVRLELAASLADR
jgi:hypothetical protein